MRLWTSALAASTGGRRSVDAFANGSGQNGQRASSRAVSEIDRSTRARSGARSCAGGAAGAGAGAGVSDAITRTQISHRRIFQHHPLVSQAWNTRSTPLRRLRLPGAEGLRSNPPHFSFLTPPPCSWNLTTRAGAKWPRAVPSLQLPWRSPWAALLAQRTQANSAGHLTSKSLTTRPQRVPGARDFCEAETGLGRGRVHKGSGCGGREGGERRHALWSKSARTARPGPAREVFARTCATG